MSMKCVYSVKKDNIISSVVIKKDRVYFIENDERQSLDVDFKLCFNTLISLYSLKENWRKTKCIDPLYIINFDDEEYCFDLNNLPDNFFMFVGYIDKLVGKLI